MLAIRHILLIYIISVYQLNVVSRTILHNQRFVFNVCFSIIVSSANATMKTNVVICNAGSVSFSTALDDPNT